MLAAQWATAAMKLDPPVPHPVTLQLLSLPVLLIKSPVTREQWMDVGRETTALLHLLAVHKTMEQLRMQAGWETILSHHQLAVHKFNFDVSKI